MATRCPYPGLRPFQPDEADLFFGRDEQIRELRRRLDHMRFLAVVGESGCGKSSLILAGLIPEIEAGFLSSAGSSWTVATFRPGSTPLTNMAATLLTSGALSRASEIEGEDVALIGAALRRGPLGLIELFQARRDPADENLLIVVDQFEELFRFRRLEEMEEGADTPVDREEATAFVALLLRTVKEKDVPIYVVLTMRSDFLGDCAFFANLPEALNEGQFLTPRLSFDQRRESIEAPARVEEGEVAPDLTLRLLNDMGTGPDQLPLMQHALMRVWSMARARDPSTPPTLTLKDYLDGGGLEQALSKHADAAFDKLTDRQKAIAERLFRALSGGNTGRRDTRRPTKLGMIADVAGVTPEAVAEVVEFFRGGDLNLLSPARGPLVRDSTIDISHESLIRQWTRLKDWVKSEATSADTYRLLAQTAARWSERGGGDLWTGHNLDSVIAWQEKERPNEVWASRYGGGFAHALRFIEASQEKRRQDQLEKELAARRELLSRWRGRLAIGAGIGFAIAMGLAFWAFAERGIAKKNLHAAIIAEENAAKAEETARHEARRANENAEDAEAKRALAERQTDFANSLILASKAQNLSTGFPVLSILLTSEALNTAQRENQVNVEAENVLRRTLSRIGGFALIEDRGRINVVNSMAFSPDGRTIASGYAGYEADGGIVLWDVAARKRLVDDPLHMKEGPVTGVAFSPDARTIAAGYPGGLMLWDVAARQRLAEVPLPVKEGPVTGVAFSPDAKTIAAGYGGSAGGGVVLWDMALAAVPEQKVYIPGRQAAGQRLAGEPFAFAVREGPVTGVAFSPDAKTIAAGFSGPHGAGVMLWNRASHKRLFKEPLSLNEVDPRGVGFSPDGKMIAAAGGAIVRLWDLSALAPTVQEPVFYGSTADPSHGAVSASLNGKWIVEASSNRARLWAVFHVQGTKIPPNVFDLSAVSTPVLRGPRPLEAAFTKDAGRFFVLGDRALGVWNCFSLNGAKPVFVSANPPEARYHSPVLSPNGRWLCLRSGASRVVLLDVNGTSPPFVRDLKPSSAKPKDEPVPEKAISPESDVDSKGFIGKQSDRTQDVTSPVDERQIQMPTTGTTFSRDHRWLATTDESKTIVVWDLNAKNPAETVFELEAKHVVAGVVFHPKMPWLFASCRDPVAMAVDVVSWKLSVDERKWTDNLNLSMKLGTAGARKSQSSEVAILDFSPDGSTLSIRRDGWLEIIDLPGNPNERATTRASWASRPSTIPLQYSLDSRWLLAPANGATCQLLALKNQPMSLEASPGMSGPDSLSDFSRDSRWLATTGNDDTVRVWDLNLIGKVRSPDESDPLPRVFPGLVRPMRVVRFDAEARRLVTVAGDGVIRIWTLDNDELLRIAARTAGRNLTRQEWNQYFPRQEYRRTFEEFAEPPGEADSPAPAGSSRMR